MKFYYENENEKNIFIEKNIENVLNTNNKKNYVEIVVELLENKYFNNSYCNIEKIDENKIEFIDDVDEYLIDEIFDDINIEFKYIKIDVDENYYLIQIDENEFEKKYEIENYNDLIKYFKHDILFDELIENSKEYKYIYNNSIGTNNINDYYYKLCYLNNNFLTFKLNNDDDNIELLYKFKKIINDEFIDDIEIYIDLNELYENNDLLMFKNYDIELYNINFILVNHNKQIIKNIDNIFEFIGSNIIKYFKLDYKIILYDELIELYNIITYNKYFDEINYENIIDEFNVDDVIDYIINDVDVNYDEINYDNFIKLNNLFYNTFKKYHLKINEKIYDNIYNIRKLNYK